MVERISRLEVVSRVASASVGESVSYLKCTGGDGKTGRQQNFDAALGDAGG